MRLCIVGKYPPIEGGVSTTTYWLARGLAERGHDVHVVTNAAEVEEPYRMLLSRDDADWYEPEFGASKGRVHVHNPEDRASETLSYIPTANPYVSKIAALCADVVRSFGCERIMAYYYEPYGVGAWMASRWTGIPLIIEHAGSDLDRLFALPALATTYREILRSADTVVTQPALMLRFLQMGVAPDRLRQDIHYSVPANAFNPDVERLDLAELALNGPAGMSSHISGPIVGIYGKIGTSKGTYDLIEALGLLAQSGLSFSFAAMIGAAQFERLKPALQKAQLLDRTYAIPFLPNWKVARFIKTCTLVCFLERDFPVAIHGPVIPREILACGGCLVVSREILDKQFLGSSIVNGKNALVAEDPRNHGELAALLRPVIEVPEAADAIGRRGYELSCDFEHPSVYVDGWESILCERQESRSVQGNKQDTSQPILSNLGIVFYPDLLLLLRACCPDLAGTWDDLRLGPGDPVAIAMRFCDLTIEQLSDARLEHAAKLLAAFKFQRAVFLSGSDLDHSAIPSFSVRDVLTRRSLTADLTGQLCPVRSNHLFVQAFQYNVIEMLAQGLDSQSATGNEIAKQVLESLEPQRSIFLFLRLPNFATKQFQIDANTAFLLQLCDGTLTVAEIIKKVGCAAGLSSDASQPVIEALQRLYKLRVIVFGPVARQGVLWNDGIAGPLPVTE